MMAAFGVCVGSEPEKLFGRVYRATVCCIEEPPSSLSDVALVEPIVQARVYLPACEDKLIDLAICFKHVRDGLKDFVR